MTLYGEQIGKKFEPDGSPRWYPGNTVIADVTAGSSGYVAMTRVREMALASGIGDTLILLPEDSYHMTVLRGLNDQVRTDAFWPASLPKDAPMSAVDDYVSRAVARVPMPGPARMRFAGVRVDAADFRVLLAPADEAQAQELQRFRDLGAASIGLFLPGHAEYGYHITLAYIRTIAQGDQARRLEALLSDMEGFLLSQPPFETSAPYMAYYNDMLAFSAQRISRRERKWDP